MSGLWSDGTKWTPAGAPVNTDTVCVTVSGTYTVTVNSAQVGNSLTLGATGNTGVQTVSIQGTAVANAVLTLSSASTIASTGLLDFTSIAATGATLSVTAGVLTNNGAMTVNPGSGGARNITASLVNNGLVTISTAASLNKSSGVHTNNGAFTIAGVTLTMSGLSQTFTQSGGTLAVNGAGSFLINETGSGVAFAFNGGAISQPSGGTIIIGGANLNLGPAATGPATFRTTGAVDMTGNVPAGVIIDVMGIATSNASLTSAAGYTNAGTINLTSSAATGSTLAVTAGTLTNTGTINSDVASGGARIITAALSNSPTGSININANTTVNKLNASHANNGNFTIATGRQLTLAGSTQTFNQNGGTLTINGGGGAFNVEETGSVTTFVHNGGTITQVGGGTILINGAYLTFGPGATGPATYLLNGQVDMTGDVPSGVTINVTGTALTNGSVTSATSYVNAGTINLTSVAATMASLSITSGILTNTGAINSNAGAGGARTFNANLLNNGAFTVNAATTFNQVNGVYTNNGAFTTNSALATFSSDETFQQNGGTLTLNGSGGFLIQIGAAFESNGGSIAQTGGALTISNSILRFGAGASGNGTFTVQSASLLSGNVPAGATINLTGTASSNATLTSASGYTNAGTINLTSTAATGATLAVTSGTLLNAGAINFNAGLGGARILTADLTNNGTTAINAATTFNKSFGLYVNNASFTTNSALLTITAGGQSFNHNGGTLTLAGGGGVAISTGASFNSNGGAIVQAGTLPITIND